MGVFWFMVLTLIESSSKWTGTGRVIAVGENNKVKEVDVMEKEVKNTSDLSKHRVLVQDLAKT